MKNYSFSKFVVRSRKCVHFFRLPGINSIELINPGYYTNKEFSARVMTTEENTELEIITYSVPCSQTIFCASIYEQLKICFS